MRNLPMRPMLRAPMLRAPICCVRPGGLAWGPTPRACRSASEGEEGPFCFFLLPTPHCYPGAMACLPSAWPEAWAGVLVRECVCSA